MSALTVCLIVKNEAALLARCLDSIQSLPAELVIVDTGSTDATPDIARRRGAKVVPFDFTVIDFAAARNHAIANSSGNWIMMIDADETLDPASPPIITTLINRNLNAGYFFERHNQSSDCTTIDQVVRLFPNHPSYRYRGRVHETLRGVRLLPSEVKLHHAFASDPAARRRKNHWYISILKEELAANPTDDTRLDFLAAEYHQLGLYTEAAEIAEQIVRVRPHDARAHLFAGTYHLLYKPNYQQARADFHEALRLQPNYPEAESFLRLLNKRENPPLT